MLPTWTSLHRELGLSPQPLAYADIQRACKENLEESTDLDWKRELPKKEDSAEFAKDVAAMANSGGGVLVYGVYEKNAQAAKPNLISTGDDVVRMLRQFLRRVQPFAHGVEFEALSPDTSQKGALVVHVPASDDAPHMFVPAGTADALSVPYRNGTMTEWMNERQIERAYAERFKRRQSQRQSLQEDLDDIKHDLDVNSRLWMTAVAHPNRPRTNATGPIPREDLSRIAAKAAEIGSAISNNRLIWNRGPDLDFNHPRVGFRRWIVHGMWPGGSEVASPDRWIVEVRHDGSVLLACAFKQNNSSSLRLPREYLEEFIADALGLVGAAAATLATGPWSIQIDRTAEDVKRVETRLVTRSV